MEEFGKLLSKQDNNEEKVLLYSKLGTLNFDTGSQIDSPKNNQSDQSIIIENIQSLRLSNKSISG